ncbi:cytochrome c-type biogenesis protein CcmH [Aureimonas altamirensis]|uniref:cytochrome c-type biogenesis protein n=1 Tax=Aureimonas altamirensis TaxID=370622 RepID=UPI001E5B0645|nr:cytochrome c-type biogenesis protein [Aureimonas altamirensis]UHD44846.1 cytochrome c-type biogenesis protein CcmH [Aureimonas altamirensis]
MRLLFALMLMFAALLPAHAVQPDEVLADPALEARARTLSAGLRCMVCQNQSIDDSDAPLARDLRLLVRERLEAGDSDRQVMSYLTDRYGEFVLLRPPFRLGTALLWGFPVLLLLAGLVFLLVRSRGRHRSEPRLTEEEERELKNLTNIS